MCKRITRPNKSGLVLKAAREARGWSMEDAASTIGCSASTLRRWEHEGFSGRTGLDTVAVLCEVYGLEPATLIEAATQGVIEPT